VETGWEEIRRYPSEPKDPKKDRIYIVYILGEKVTKRQGSLNRIDEMEGTGAGNHDSIREKSTTSLLTESSRR